MKRRDLLAVVAVVALVLGACGPLDASVRDEGTDSTTAGVKVRPPSPPGPATYWVRAPLVTSDEAVCLGTGTKGKPFCWISQAVAAADAVKATSLTVNIANGTYSEDVMVSRPTTLVGESRALVHLYGTIANWATTSLTLRRLTIKSGSSNGGVFVAGACESPLWWGSGIVQRYQVCNSPAVTTIDDVLIDGTEHWGIRQNGGTLAVGNSTIRGVWASAPEPSGYLAGAGIHLLGRASATVHDTLFDGNAQAILVQDASLSIGDFVEVRNTTNRVPGRLTIPAVEVANGGSLVARASATAQASIPNGVNSASLKLSNNLGSGIGAFSYATADLSNVSIIDTLRNPDPSIGSCAVLNCDAVVRLSSFEVLRAGLAGLCWWGVDPASDMWASYGSVEYAEVGAYVTAPGANPAQLADHVIYRNNSVNLDGSGHVPSFEGASLP